LQVDVREEDQVQAAVEQAVSYTFRKSLTKIILSLFSGAKIRWDRHFGEQRQCHFSFLHPGHTDEAIRSDAQCQHTGHLSDVSWLSFATLLSSFLTMCPFSFKGHKSVCPTFAKPKTRTSSI